ncbi:hypothetical protein TNCV_3338501 [Trichonephila clavipes]|nr:hypothetical protein TNCV_3338501 [Trichonephila clavipes]
MFKSSSIRYLTHSYCYFINSANHIVLSNVPHAIQTPILSTSLNTSRVKGFKLQSTTYAPPDYKAFLPHQYSLWSRRRMPFGKWNESIR